MPAFEENALSGSGRWPNQLIIVRHGQSAGNVARDAAHEAEEDRILLSIRDADVPLSDLGREQAAALGHWFAEQPEIGKHTSELQSLMRISYAVFCLKKKKHNKHSSIIHRRQQTNKVQ